MTLLGAIHSEPSIPSVPSDSQTTTQSQYIISHDRGNRLEAAGQSTHNSNTPDGEEPSSTPKQLTQELSSSEPRAHTSESSVQDFRIPFGKDDFLASPPIKHSPMTSVGILQTKILPTRQPHGPPAALESLDKTNFGRFSPQTYRPAGNDIERRSSHSNSTASEARNSSSSDMVSHAFDQAPRFPASRMRRFLLGEASVAKSELDQSNYLGDKETAFYKQLHIENLPHALNCSLWLANVSPLATAADIFNQIDDGAVVALQINPPDATHLRSGATLIFKAPESAAQFMDRAKSRAGIWIKGEKLFVRYNIRGNKRRSEHIHRTRVLVIEGVSSSP